MTSDISTQIVEFVTSVMTAMGAMPRVESSESGDTLRIDVEGEGAEALLFQRGEGLRALQTLVNTAFRRQPPFSSFTIRVRAAAGRLRPEDGHSRENPHVNPRVPCRPC